MQIAIPKEDSAIIELSRRIVSHVAPEEMDLFDEMMAEYYDDPRPPDDKPIIHDDPLGFGLSEVIFAATPAALAMTYRVIPFLLALTQRKAPNIDSTSQISNGERPQAPIGLTLSRDELGRLHDIAMQTAIRYGMKASVAREMTNSLVIGLLLAPTPGDEPVGPVKILFLAANPLDTERLRLDREIRVVQNSLDQCASHFIFELEQEWAVRVSDLQKILLKHQPNIVNFSGHGSWNGEIILEDNQGMSHPVPPSALSDLFGLLQNNIRCVVLNACYSHSQAEAIVEHVDAVIGMPGAIDDSMAIAFSRSFYQALAYGQDIQTAFHLGLNQVELLALERDSVPILLTRNGVLPDRIFAQSLP